MTKTLTFSSSGRARWRRLAATAIAFSVLCPSTEAGAKPSPKSVTRDFAAGSLVSNPKLGAVAYVDGAGRIAVRTEAGRLERRYDSPAGCRPVSIASDAIGLDCGLRLLLRSSGEVVDMDPGIAGVDGYTLQDVGTHWIAAEAYVGDDPSHQMTQDVLVNRSTRRVVNLAEDAGGPKRAITLDRSTPYKELCKGVRRHAVGTSAPPYLPAVFLRGALFELNAEAIRSKSRLTTCKGAKARYISGTSHRFSVFNGHFLVEGANDAHRTSTVLRRVRDGRKWTYPDSSAGGALGGSSALLSSRVLWIENGAELFRVKLVDA